MSNENAKRQFPTNFRQILVELHSSRGRSAVTLTPEIVDAIKAMSRAEGIYFLSAVLVSPNAQSKVRPLKPSRRVTSGVLREEFGEKAFAAFIEDAPASGIHGQELERRREKMREAFLADYSGDKASGISSFNEKLRKLGIKNRPRGRPKIGKK